jgi:polysaccharide biosynthesis/export protein
MKSRHLIYIFFIIALFNFSCTPYKNVPYFQDVNRDSVLTEKISNYSPLTVQNGDLLAVHVTSLNHEADGIFNYNLERPSGLNVTTGELTGGGQAENTVYGYLVDNNGNIHLPMVDNVNVAGKTTDQIADELQKRLSEVLSHPVVNIRIENFKVSVLGDVKNPGVYTSANERLNINEAIAFAGDINTTGIRTILIIREINGVRKYITLDMRSKSLINSPYYYLKNNDVIYVQPNKDRVASSDSALARISLIIAALSIVAIYLSNTKK